MRWCCVMNACVTGEGWWQGLLSQQVTYAKALPMCVCSMCDIRILQAAMPSSPTPNHPPSSTHTQVWRRPWIVPRWSATSLHNGASGVSRACWYVVWCCTCEPSPTKRAHNATETTQLVRGLCTRLLGQVMRAWRGDKPQILFVSQT